MTAPSLQRQLMVPLVAALCGMWLIGVLLAGVILRHELNQVFDRELQETAERILPLAVVELYNTNDGQVDKLAPALKTHEKYLTYQIQNAAGEVLIRSRSARQDALVTDLQEGFFSQGGYRVYITSAVSGQYFIQVAESLEHRHEVLLAAMAALTLPLLLLLPLGLLLAALLIRSVIQPLQNFSAAVAKRGGGDLSVVEAQKLPRDFAPIELAVNQLLLRLRQTLEAERSFTANAAHELRTPLASLLVQVQRLQHHLRPQLADPIMAARVTQVEQTIRDMAQMADKLMQLAKAEGGGLLAEQELDLLPLVELVVADARRLASVDIVVQVPPQPVMLAIDADAFVLLLRNLLENAIKHGYENEPITISLDEQARLRLVNGCDLIPAPQLARLRERFFRGNTESSGNGLGLAIADTLVQGLGGYMQLQSPAQGREDGFEVVVEFPFAR